MGIEHFPDPCGPGCVARGMVTDTIDGREHDSCLDAEAEVLDARLGILPDVDDAGTIFDPATLSPEVLREIAFRVNASGWDAMVPISADAAQALTVCIFGALASVGIRFADTRSGPTPCGVH